MNQFGIIVHADGRLANTKTNPDYREVFPDLRTAVKAAEDFVSRFPLCSCQIIDPADESGEEVIITADKASWAVAHEIWKAEQLELVKNNISWFDKFGAALSTALAKALKRFS